MTTSTLAPVRSDLDQLVAAVRGAIARSGDWHQTAGHVADALRRHLLSPDQRAGEPGTSRGHRLHVEPDGTFSMVAIVWQPGAVTRIHDHVTWCVFGVLEGCEYEDLYTAGEDGTGLVQVGGNANHTGEVSGFAPPGDIHRVRNIDDRTAISLHIYGTDLSRIGSSVRRYYD